MAESPGRRMVGKMDVHSGAVLTLGSKMNTAGVSDHRARQALPGQHALRLEERELGVPLQLRAGRAAYHPVPAVAAGPLNLEDVRHEEGEILELRPIAEDVLDRRLDADCL